MPLARPHARVYAEFASPDPRRARGALSLAAPCTLQASTATPSRASPPSRWSAPGLAAGETLPFDRAWAIENGPGRFDPAQPRHLPKINFLMLMRDERLATLRTKFDDATRDADHPARRQAGGPRPADDPARAAAHRAVHRRLHEGRAARAPQDRARARATASPTSRPSACTSSTSPACASWSARLGRPVDPLRFRANLYLEGVAPWAEFGWIGKEIGVGESRLAVFARTTRCEATNVDPARGVRDMAHAGPPAAHLGPPGLRHLRQGCDGRRDRRRCPGRPPGVTG